MKEEVYNSLILLCDKLIYTALYELMDIDIFDIWNENRDTELKNCVLVQLRSIYSIRDRIVKLHNADKILGGTDNEKTNS